jgi:(1->4)-alpha-D-glucan 1-alpha-D-glucosylmutase
MNQALTQPLRATLRLQFHKGFTLDDAVPLVPYFASLGISHVYASPLLSARAGSMHGYDVVDPTTVNPELGGEVALRRLVSALREQKMGLILDIVSNHMAVGGGDNPWWLDLLEWGRLSPYGEFFDIQWHSPDPLMEGQLLLPFLGSDYGVALQDGTLPLRFDAGHGAFHVEHYDHHFPICPSSYGELLKADEQLDNEQAEQLKLLADRFSTLSYQTDAHSLAKPLQDGCANWRAIRRFFKPSSATCKCLRLAHPGRFPAPARPAGAPELSPRQLAHGGGRHQLAALFRYQ